MQDLNYLVYDEGDVIIPPAEGLEDEVATLVWFDEDDRYLVITLDDSETISIDVHESQIDQLIEAIKTVKEYNQ